MKIHIGPELELFVMLEQYSLFVHENRLYIKLREGAVCLDSKTWNAVPSDRQVQRVKTIGVRV